MLSAEEKETRRQEAAIRKEVEKAEREKAKAKAEAEKVKQHSNELYLKCEAQLKERKPSKGRSVLVDCKYKKKAAIEEVARLYKQSGYNVTIKFMDPHDPEDPGGGPRTFLIFTH